MKRTRPLLALALGCATVLTANTAAAGGPGPDATTERMLRLFESVENDWFFVKVPAGGTIPPPQQQCISVDQVAKTFGLDVPSTTIPQDLVIDLRDHGQSARLAGSASDDHIMLIVGSDTVFPMARGRTRCVALAAEIEQRMAPTEQNEPTAKPPVQASAAPWYVIDMNGRGPVSCVLAATLVQQLSGGAVPDPDPHAVAAALVARGQHLWFVNEDDIKGMGAVFMGYANSPTEQAYVLERGLAACQAQKAKINSVLLMSRLQAR